MIEFKIPRQSLVSKFSDICMVPVMYALQFPSLETPQKTHRWNNIKRKASYIAHFDSGLMVAVSEDTKAANRWLGPLPVFHMPIFGGWKEFVVLEPVVPQDEWYVGWVVEDDLGVSQVKLSGRVRLLKGPYQVFFFGVNEHGDQIHLQQVGGGKLRTKHDYKKVPLL